MANRKYPNAVQAKKAKQKVSREYKKRAFKLYAMRFHRTSDSDIIERLDAVGNKPDYIRRLIRKDIAENGK